jgi:hypothetical protein
MGNMATFATGFALAAALKDTTEREVKAKFIYVDSAPAPSQDAIRIIKGVMYQKSLRQTGDFQSNQSAFVRVLDRLAELSGVAYDLETQDFWRSNPALPTVLQSIVARSEILGPHMSPETGKLAIRAPCPHEGCGLADKHGVNNQYHDDGRMSFVCPEHGEHYIDPTSRRDRDRLEFNTPLRNLIRILICSQDRENSWIMCTGADYAGFYQEQLTWRLLEHPQTAPIIFYAPLILDWSGVKLSKSLYVKQGAYQYLRNAGREYMLDADTFLQTTGGLDALFGEVQDWVQKPYMLFRNYSIDYLDMQLVSRGMQLLQTP